MRKYILGGTVLLFLFIVGSAYRADAPAPVPALIPVVETQRPDPVAPFDIRPTISLIGRFGMAHACPIGADLVVTNAHVTDVQPTTNMPLLPSRAWSEVEGDLRLTSRGVSYAADLALMGPAKEPLRFYFPIAPAAPSVGSQLYWVGYDWRHKADMFKQRVFSGKVIRVVAGNIIIDEETVKGSSGSCLFDAQGRVLGVISWGLTPDADKEGDVTVAVGIHSIWHDDVLPPAVKQ